MKKSVITSDFEKKAAAPLMYQSRHKLQKLKKVLFEIQNCIH